MPLVSGSQPQTKILPMAAYRQVPSAFRTSPRSLTILYDHSWYHLSGRVLITLLNLIQLPSLHHLHILMPPTPRYQAIGENVKHLVLNGIQKMNFKPFVTFLTSRWRQSTWTHFQLMPGIPVRFPDCRVITSRLRKLVVREQGTPRAIRSLLQSCNATLQDFDLRPPSYERKSCISGFISFLFNSSTFI